MPVSLPSPTPSELDVLAVLWAAVTDEGAEGLRVSDIHPRVAARRAQHGEAQPALVTISSQLRGLVGKGLVRPVVVGGKGERTPKRVRTRGLLKASSRSPLTGYVPAHTPGEVLRATLEALASAYPESQRADALLDFAKALKLPVKTIEKLKRLLSSTS